MTTLVQAVLAALSEPSGLLGFPAPEISLTQGTAGALRGWTTGLEPAATWTTTRSSTN